MNVNAGTRIPDSIRSAICRSSSRTWTLLAPIPHRGCKAPCFVCRIGPEISIIHADCPGQRIYFNLSTAIHAADLQREAPFRIIVALVGDEGASASEISRTTMLAEMPSAIITRSDA